MPYPACNGSRMVQRRIRRVWRQVLLLRLSIGDGLCVECGGTGLVKGSPEEEELFKRVRSRERLEVDFNTLGLVITQLQRGHQILQDIGREGLEEIDPPTLTIACQRCHAFLISWDPIGPPSPRTGQSGPLSGPLAPRPGERGRSRSCWNAPSAAAKPPSWCSVSRS